MLTLIVEVYFKMFNKSSKLSSTLPLIPMILTDMNLKAVLVFILFVAELANNSGGSDMLIDDMLHQVCPPVTFFVTDGTTVDLVTLLHHHGRHPVIIPEI